MEAETNLIKIIEVPVQPIYAERVHQLAVISNQITDARAAFLKFMNIADQDKKEGKYPFSTVLSDDLIALDEAFVTIIEGLSEGAGNVLKDGIAEYQLNRSYEEAAATDPNK